MGTLLRWFALTVVFGVIIAGFFGTFLFTGVHPIAHAGHDPVSLAGFMVGFVIGNIVIAFFLGMFVTIPIVVVRWRIGARRLSRERQHMTHITT